MNSWWMDGISLSPLHSFIFSISSKLPVFLEDVTYPPEWTEAVGVQYVYVRDSCFD